MTFFGTRIRYGSREDPTNIRLTLIQEPLLKGTYLSFNDDPIRYSYLARGKLEAIHNMELGFEGFKAVGDLQNFNPMMDRVLLTPNKAERARYIAIHEDGELICFLSKTHNPTMSLHHSDKEIRVEPNICCIILEGEFELEGKIADKFAMVLERDYPIVLKGTGKLLKVKF